MFTQCRGCGEIFQVIVDDLVTASAMVRCSSCGTVFNALDTLSDYKPQQSTDLILHENDNPPPLLTHEFKESIVKPSIQKTAPIKKKPVENIDEGVVYNVKPDFVANEVTKNKKTSLMWPLLSILLLALLFWQTSMALKNGSLKLPAGSLRDSVCGVLICYKQMHNSNISKIALVSRSIRQHPGRDNALIIRTGIMNNDSQIQEFPALQVKMSNLNGDIVAMRRFLPHEYIDSETIQAGMLPNTLVQITLELQSPGNNAVTFEVGFSPTYGANQN
ncbi:MAG: zinc-ribbon and DUF3426 domain-containing protein [Marinicellaceae bacterium]